MTTRGRGGVKIEEQRRSIVAGILKVIEKIQYEEKHLLKCRGVTSYTDGVDSWDETDLNKCDCGRWSRINQKIAEAWEADLRL